MNVDQRPLWRVLLCLLLAGLLAGCSARVFFYKRLDFLIPWWVNGYVDLDRDQNARLDALLDPFLRWHRTEELPRYAALVNETRRLAVAQRVPLPDLTRLADDLEAAWYRLRDRALEALLVLGATLNEAQVAAFVATLRDRQAEYEEEYLSRSDAEYREQALERLEDTLGDYLGRLDDAQVARLQQAVDDLRRIDSGWLTVRARWIDRVERALRREPGWRSRLRTAVHDWEARAPRAYLDGVQHNSAVVLAAVSDVLSRRSERQTRRLQRELDALRRDLAKLLEQPG